MAHIQQQEFCKSTKNKFEDFFKNKYVLDIGSLDINGNNQEYFENCNYIGVDIALGRNVDIISKGHELGFPDNTFDTIISTECFEHDKYYIKTIKNIYRMLKPGGLFLFTCATIGRPEHGTRRTTPDDAPFLQKDTEWSDYYKNLKEDDIREILDIDKSFKQYEFSTNETSHDLYFYGFKNGEFQPRDDYSFLLFDKPRQMPYFIQLFIDQGDGITEKNSIKFPVEKIKEPQEFTFDLSDIGEIRSLRLDPLNDCCVIQIDKLEMIMKDGNEIDLVPYLFTNDCSHHGESYFFESHDPQMSFINLDNKILRYVSSIKVKFKYPHISKEAAHACANQIAADKNYIIASLEDEKQELNRLIQSNENDLSNLRQEKQELDHKIVLRDEQISQLKEETEALKQTIIAREEEISDFIKEKKAFNKTIALKDDIIASLKDEKKELDRVIQSNENDLSNLMQEKQELDHKIVLRDEQISQLKEETETLKQIVTELRENKTDHEQEKKEFQQTITLKDNIIASLENENKELNQVMQTKNQNISNIEEELVNLYLSKSWKITRPLRSIMRTLKKLKLV